VIAASAKSAAAAFNSTMRIARFAARDGITHEKKDMACHALFPSS
jgi:hypothetical protein